MKLNLGCGSQVPDGWINVDYALGARFAKLPFFRILNKKIKIFNMDWNQNIFIHNLIKPLPWDNDSVDVIYISHTLEHFSKDDGCYLLDQCQRVLKKGGFIRIVVPDLKYIIEKYSTGKLRANDFIKELGINNSKDRTSIKNKIASLFQFQHKCMYDTQTLVEVLKEIGFLSQSKQPFDSDIMDIKTVELENRTKNAVIVEGRKM